MNNAMSIDNDKDGLGPDISLPASPPPASPAFSAPSGGEPKPIYDLEPPDDFPNRPTSDTPLPRGRVVEAGAKKPEQRPNRVGDAGLMDDFDEDADFTRDPEVERALKGAGPIPAPDGDSSYAASKRPVFIKPGLGSAEHLGFVAGGLLIGAVITAGVTAASRGRAWLPDVILTSYLTAFHTLTGVVAVAVTAYFAKHKTGDLALAAARMGLAVAMFQLVFHLNIPIPSRVDEVFFACLAYVAVVWGLFRVTLDNLVILVAVHAGLWTLVYVSAVLYGWAIVEVVTKPV